MAQIIQPSRKSNSDALGKIGSIAGGIAGGYFGSGNPAAISAGAAVGGEVGAKMGENGSEQGQVMPQAKSEVAAPQQTAAPAPGGEQMMQQEAMDRRLKEQQAQRIAQLNAIQQGGVA